MKNALSLFHGMGCFNLALDRTNIQFDQIYTSEIEPAPNTVDAINNPNNINLGDVTQWRTWAIDWTSIELLVAGSPCQGFSNAGNQGGFDDPRSALFYDFVLIRAHIDLMRSLVGKSPCLFLLENVKMRKDWADLIDFWVGCKPVFIDSNLISAQNRARYYWANWDFTPPCDSGVVLADILDTTEQEPNGEGWQKWWQKNRDFQLQKKYSTICNDGSITKAACLTARQYASWNGNFVKCDGVDLYRNLTPVECERLQTVPDNYTAHVSNTQRYKMLGNGWTVDVIAHILRSAPL